MISVIPADLRGQGTWSSPYAHPVAAGSPANWPAAFKAINMAVIPNDTDPVTGLPTGRVIVWDNNEASQGTPGPWKQRFAVGAPETPSSWQNYEVTIPVVNGVFFGDLFCAGHCWLPDGRLFVAGGNTVYQVAGNGHYEGSQFVGIWDPTNSGSPTNGWDFVPLQLGRHMAKKRWYPTCTLLANGTVIVAGGSENTLHSYCGAQNDGAFNTYEVWNIAANDWERDSTLPGNPPKVYPGPLCYTQYSGGVPTGSPVWCWSVLGEYPRMHLLSTNKVFLAGMFTGSNRLWHNRAITTSSCATPLLPAIVEADWDTNRAVTPAGCASLPWRGPYGNSYFRSYGASVLVPNVGNTPGADDLVMGLGGGGQAQEKTQLVDAAAAVPVWTDGPQMHYARECLNAVLLPNGEVIALGGSTTDGFHLTGNEVREVEIFDKVGGWRLDTPHYSNRMYHSTAALLPTGRIVAGGGDLRDFLPGSGVLRADYEVFTPSYLSHGQARPVFQGAWAPSTTAITLQYGAGYLIEHEALPVGVSLSRVVLMRPCSVTHHSDMDQRYVELARVTPPPSQTLPVHKNWVYVQTPTLNATSTATGSVLAPPGYYMAFLITSQETPSLARWVQLP